VYSQTLEFLLNFIAQRLDLNAGESDVESRRAMTPKIKGLRIDIFRDCNVTNLLVHKVTPLPSLFFRQPYIDGLWMSFVFSLLYTSKTQMEEGKPNWWKMSTERSIMAGSSISSRQPRTECLEHCRYTQKKKWVVRAKILMLQVQDRKEGRQLVSATNYLANLCHRLYFQGGGQNILAAKRGGLF